MLEVFNTNGRSDAASALVQERVVAVRHLPRPVAVRATPAAGAPPRLAFREVLQHVHLRESGAAGSAPPEPWLFNERILSVLEACHGVDTARRQLLGILNTRSTLENVSHILVARVEAGFSAVVEQRKLALLMADLRQSVEEATRAWEVASRHFTRLTRLLPSQLNARVDGFVPVDPAEIDRLAQLSLLACPLTKGHLKQVALEGAQRRDLSPELVVPTAHELSVWASRLHQARTQAISRFAQSREAYLQAVVAWEMAQAMVMRSRFGRQAAEAGFRIGTRGVLEFAQATIDQHRHRNELLHRESGACMARFAMFALALQLPEQFGL